MATNIEKFRSEFRVTMALIKANMAELDRAHGELRRRIEALFALPAPHH